MLGHYDMNAEHKKLCEFLQEKTYKLKMNLLPRYSYKSSLITIGYSVWRIFSDPDIRILIYSDNASKASRFLDGIKGHFEGKIERSRFADYCGNFVSKKRWNIDQITVRKRKKAYPEPTVDTGGIEKSKVGMHYDLIIFDDIVSDLNIGTKQQLDKVYECYTKSMSLLKPGGDIIIVGTRWHFSDAYGRIIKENQGNKKFGLFIRNAEDKKENGTLMFEDIEPSLDKEFLDDMKKKQGSYLFSCLYNNNPVDSDEAVFKSCHFSFYGEVGGKDNVWEDGLYNGLYTTLSLDPAGMGSDPTAGVVVGTDSEMRMHVLEIINTKLLPTQMIDWILNMNDKYRLKRVGIEENFFRGMLKKELDRRVLEEINKREGFHMFGTDEIKATSKGGDNKFSRISGLQPYHERGHILFPGNSVESLRGGFSDLAYQMLQLTPSHMPEPNDCLDALAMHLLMLQKGGVAEKKQIKPNTPAWLENKWVTEHNRMQRRLPRNKRRMMHTVLS